jgi:hypothetical protein
MIIKVLDKEISIDLPPNSEKIHVMVSGGMDSALILYLLVLFSQRRHEIVAYTVPKTDGAWTHANAVIDWLRTRMNANISGPIPVGNPRLEHDFQVRSGFEEALDHYKAPKLWLAENQNPSPEFKMGGLYPNRMAENKFDYLVTPFLHLYKSHIVQLCKDLALDELITLTHTCTELRDDRCGACFACTERAWGFEQAQWADPSPY